MLAPILGRTLYDGLQNLAELFRILGRLFSPVAAGGAAATTFSDATTPAFISPDYTSAPGQ